MTIERLTNFVRRKWLQLRLLLADFREVPATLLRMRRSGRTPYVIAGVSYGPKSAGCTASHWLVHQLNEAGYDAAATGTVNPLWNERRLSRLGCFALVRIGNPIVVYPEAVPGNPLRAKRVARWVMNVPGHMGGDAQYDRNELVFAWSRKFYDTERILSMDLVEKEFFNDENLPPKDIDCSYFGKGSLRGVTPISLTDDMPEITSKWPSTRPELAQLLRRTRTLYTYDNLTQLSYEALLCGCRVVVLPEMEEFAFDDPFWQFIHEDHNAQLARFIAETQQHWRS